MEDIQRIKTPAGFCFINVKCLRQKEKAYCLIYDDMAEKGGNKDFLCVSFCSHIKIVTKLLNGWVFSTVFNITDFLILFAS